MKSVGVILAAGRGVRLGKLTANIQKGLLKIGDCSLIARQIDCLFQCGIADVHIVVGFAEEKVREALADCIKSGNVNCIFNPKWDSANNIYSLYLAREVVSDGFVLINSDDLFHTGILRQLLGDQRSDAISVDDFKKLGKEEMKVKLEDGALREINKTMEPVVAQGEYIGIAKFGSQGAKELFEVLNEFVERGDLDGWYEEAFGSEPASDCSGQYRRIALDGNRHT